MLNITYAPSDAEIAERIQRDLQKANDDYDANILIVLITPESVTDTSVLRAIQSASSHHHVIVPVLLRQARLPEAIRDLDVIDLSKGYDFAVVSRGLRRAVTDKATRRRNSQIGWVLLIIASISFVLSMIGLASGYIGVPVDEFQTEAAIQNSMIETLTFPTLDPLMPRTTQDAENFPMTVEAANTRNAPLLQQTATALPLNAQASQEAFLTIEAATSTARASED